jgi:hypothetical protein
MATVAPLNAAPDACCDSTFDVELVDVDEASLDECIDAIADLLIAAALAEPSHTAPTN